MRIIISFILLFSFWLSNAQTLIPYRYNQKWGYANDNGEIVIEPNYDRAEWFNELNYARVKSDDQWGIINKKGEIAIEIKHSMIFNFCEGLAAFCEGGQFNWIQGEIIGGKWGFYNEKGEVVIPAKFHRTDNFVNGYCIVQIENDNWGNWGVIDKNGRQILPFKYPSYSFDMRPFPGLRWDENEKGKLWYRKGQWDETWIQIDLKGNPTGKKNESIHGEYALDNSPVSIEKNGKFALKSKDGKMLTPFEFDHGIYFYDNNEVASMVKNGKFGLINKNGSILVQPEFDYIKIADKYLILQKNKKYAIADHSGKPLNGGNSLDWEDSTIHYLGEDMFRVKMPDGFKLMLYNGIKTGNKIFENTGSQFQEGLLKVCENGSWGFIDKSGKLVIDYKYPYVNDFESGYAMVDMNPEQYEIPDQGLINKKGIEFFYNPPMVYESKLSNGQKILKNEKGKIILTGFNSFEILDEKYVRVNLNQLTQVLDFNGNLLTKGKILNLITACRDQDPDLNDGPICYYAAVKEDSIDIYNHNFNKTFSVKHDWIQQDFDLFKNKHLIIEETNDKFQIRTAFGDYLGRKFEKIFYLPESKLFMVYGKNDSVGLYASYNEFVSEFKKQRLSVIPNGYISFEGKDKNQIANLYDMQGRKLNQNPATNIHQSYQIKDFYFIENDKTKKRGYYWNGEMKEAIYDDIYTIEFGIDFYVMTKSGTKLSLFNNYGKKMFEDEFNYFQANNSCAVVAKNGKYGIVAIREDKPVTLISLSYDDIPELSEFPELIPVKKGNHYVYINPQEEVIIDKNLSYALPFSDGQAFAKVNEKTGVIDENGNWIVQPEYKNMDYWYGDNQIKVYTAHSFENKKMLFNSVGKNILPEEIDSLNFEIIENYNYIAAFSGKKAGVLDYEGKLIVPAKYISIRSFYVETEDSTVQYFVAQTEKGYGLLNLEGKEITPMQYDKIYQDEDLYTSGIMNLIPVSVKGKNGVLDLKGNEIIPCLHSAIDWYGEETESLFIRMQKEGKWGLFGKDGKIIYETQFDKLFVDWDITDISEQKTGLIYQYKINGKYGILNSSGKIILNAEYSGVFPSYDCDNGQLIEIQKGKYKGLAQLDGTIILSPEYKSYQCNVFREQLYFVVEYNKKFKILQSNGKEVNDKLYDAIDWSGEDKMAISTRDKQWFYINADGSETPMED